MVDTNCDPNKVDFAIPSNDDATKSIAIIVNYITAAIAEGLAERQAAKDEDVEDVPERMKTKRKLPVFRQKQKAKHARGRGEKVRRHEHRSPNAVFRTQGRVVPERDNAGRLRRPDLTLNRCAGHRECVN